MHTKYSPGVAEKDAENLNKSVKSGFNRAVLAVVAVAAVAAIAVGAGLTP